MQGYSVKQRKTVPFTPRERKTMRNGTVCLIGPDASGANVSKIVSALHAEPYKSLPERPVEAVMVGEGVLDDIAQVAKNAYSAVTGGIRVGPGPRVRKVLADHGGERVTGLSVLRAPIGRMVKALLNAITLGKLSERMRTLGYDDVFHLEMVIKLESGKRLTYDKNEVVTLVPQSALKDKSEVIEVPVSGRFTLQEFMDITIAKIGADAYWRYESTTTNCQRFVLDHLEAHGLSTARLRKFILQSGNELLGNSPAVRALIRATTDGAALADIVKNGRGMMTGAGFLESLSPFISSLLQGIFGGQSSAGAPVSGPQLTDNSIFERKRQLRSAARQTSSRGL